METLHGSERQERNEKRRGNETRGTRRERKGKASRGKGRGSEKERMVKGVRIERRKKIGEEEEEEEEEESNSRKIYLFSDGAQQFGGKEKKNL
ncbi:hypothetical protein RUM44_003563 [Polyplax serrata]|uniref:Uncharacterized protein n=1 Tax=Polyplax serrata TaxID=468196 RepID=A0ABR1AGU9_POLSC